MPFKQTAWSLDDLFPGTDSPELEDAFNQLEVQVEKFEIAAPALDEIFVQVVQGQGEPA